MVETIMAAALVLAVLGSMWAYTWKKIPAWNERGFADKGLQWKPVVSWSLVGGVVSAGAGFALSGQWYVAVTLSILGYLAVLATATDLSVMKIPSDISIMAYWLPAALPVLWWSTVDTFSLIAWAIMVFLLLAITVVHRGMGFADLRILFLTTTGFAWWVGIMPMLYALIGACVLQLLLFAFTSKEKFGVVKEKGTTTVVNPETKRLEAGEEKNASTSSKTDIADDANFLPGDDDASEDVATEAPASDRVKKKKKKRHAPFGPALLVSFLVAALYVAATQELPELTWTTTVLASMFY